MCIQQSQIGVALPRLEVLGGVAIGRRKPVARKEQQDAQPADGTHSDQIDTPRHRVFPVEPRSHFLLHKIEARKFKNKSTFSLMH